MLNTIVQTTTPILCNPTQSKRVVRYKAAYAFRGKGHVVARIKGSAMMDISLNLVELRREQEELQFAETVETWLRHIRDEVRIARHESMAKVTQIVEKQLKVRYGAEALIAAASQERVLMLLEQMQHKLMAYLGIRSRVRSWNPVCSAKYPLRKPCMLCIKNIK